jgi:hypothetical protein
MAAASAASFAADTTLVCLTLWKYDRIVFAPALLSTVPPCEALRVGVAEEEAEAAGAAGLAHAGCVRVSTMLLSMLLCFSLTFVPPLPVLPLVAALALRMGVCGDGPDAPPVAVRFLCGSTPNGDAMVVWSAWWS